MGCPGWSHMQGKFDRHKMNRPIVETKVEETWFAWILNCRDMSFADGSYKNILCSMGYSDVGCVVQIVGPEGISHIDTACDKLFSPGFKADCAASAQSQLPSHTSGRDFWCLHRGSRQARSSEPLCSEHQLWSFPSNSTSTPKGLTSFSLFCDIQNRENSLRHCCQ